MKLCKCGCGNPIIFKPLHKQNRGGTYLSGHNKRNTGYKAQTHPTRYCACGCGNPLLDMSAYGPVYDLRRRFISGHNVLGTGRGWILCNGYKRSTRHKDKWRYLHTLIMERHLGRRLTRGEVVHHKNGNKLDNRLSNLSLMTISEHVAAHDSDRPRTASGQFASR